MVFATTLIGQNAMSKASGFEGGNLAVTDLEAAMAEIETAQPILASASTGGTLTINGSQYGSYDYSVHAGGTYTSPFTSTDFFSATNNRHALVCFKGDTTISGGTFEPPSSSTGGKICFCIYVKGNLTISGNISTKGCKQSSSGLYTTDANNFKLSSGFTVTTSSYRCGEGGNGGNGGSGGAGGIFSGGAGGSGGPSCGTTGTWNGQAYGGVGGRNTTGGFSGYMVGGGAGNPGGAGFNSGIGGSANPGGTGTGGMLVIIATGSITRTSGQLISAGFNGGSAFHGQGSQAAGGGGSGGGRIYHKSTSNNIGANYNVTGGGGGSGEWASGQSGQGGNIHSFT